MGSTSQYKRLIAFVIAIVGLMILPIVTEIYYTTFYFIGFIILIPIAIVRILKDKKFEELFFKRWHKSREKEFWMNVICEGLRSLIIMIVVISLIQFIINGRTPLEIVLVLPRNILAGLMVFLIILNFIAGITLWFENEKRYDRMKVKKEFEK